MPKTKIQKLNDFGQSIWLDSISRSLVRSGKLQKLIDIGVSGITSNPTIFNEAISAGHEYDENIIQLKEKGKSVIEIYDELTVKDIQDAADLFEPVFEATSREDGYVSLEINPHLANKKEESVKEGLRLFYKVNRPNLMIKVPVTKIGPEVIEELIAQGVNVNATLIFSPEQYWQAVWAYFKGLEKYSKTSTDLNRINSVASVFVSRIDTAVDHLIDLKMTHENDSALKDRLQSLKGKAAVANSGIILEKFTQMFSSDYFRALANKGARVQRALWASTGTKNPLYSDIKYITELIAPSTVNTLPEKTLNAFLDHGEIKQALKADLNETQRIFAALNQFDIDINKIHLRLLDDGVVVFCKSFDGLLKSITAKIEAICVKP